MMGSGWDEGRGGGPGELPLSGSPVPAVGKLLNDETAMYLTVIPRRRLASAGAPGAAAAIRPQRSVWRAPSSGAPGGLDTSRDAVAAAAAGGTASGGSVIPQPTPTFPQRLVAVFLWLAKHPRTERSLRFSLFFIAAFYCSYDKWAGENFAYTTALLYTICAALVPPNMAAVSIDMFLIFPASLTACAFLTLALTVGVAVRASAARGVMLALSVLPILIGGLMRGGPFAALTSIVAIMMVYPYALGFFNIFAFVADGLALAVPFDDFRALLDQLVAGLPDVVLQNPAVQQLLETLKMLLGIIDANPDYVVQQVIDLPPVLGEYFPDFKPLVGVPIDLSIGKNAGLRASVTMGSWLPSLIWTGRGPLGVMRQLLRYGLIAIGLHIASLIFFPPQRYTRSWLRHRLALGAEGLGKMLAVTAADAGWRTSGLAIAPGGYEPEAWSKAPERMNSPTGDAGRHGAKEERSGQNDLRDQATQDGWPKSSQREGVPQLGDPRSCPVENQVDHVLDTGVAHTSENAPSEAPRGGTTLHFDVRSNGNSSKKTNGGNVQSRGNQGMAQRGDESDHISAHTERRTVGEGAPSWGAATPDGQARSNSFRFAAAPVVAAEPPGNYSNAPADGEKPPGPTAATTPTAAADLSSLPAPLCRRACLGLGEVLPLVLSSSMEPSFASPGMFTSYQRSWTPLVAAIRHAFAHTALLADAVCGRQASAIFGPKGVPFDAAESVTHAVRALDEASRGIALRPATRGGQWQAIQASRRSLQGAVEAVARVRANFAHALAGSAGASGPLGALPWRRAAAAHAALVSFYQVACEAPIRVGAAADTLLTRESRGSPAGLLKNVLGVLAPFFMALYTLVTSVLRLFCPCVWGWRRAHPRYLWSGDSWVRSAAAHDVVRWVLGAAALFALPIFNEPFRTWLVSSGGGLSGGMADYLEHPRTTKVVGWSLLGFVVTLYGTAEGTLRRALLRVAGVVAGSVFGYVCGLAVGVDNRGGQLAWLFLTITAAVWIGGNSDNALFGFHTSWGYAAQVFTYQQTIIVVESYYTIQSLEELVAARLMGQLIGISTACLVATLVLPTYADVEMAKAATEALHCSTQSFLAMMDGLLAEGEEDGGDAAAASALSAPWPWENAAQNRKTFARIVALLTGTRRRVAEKGVGGGAGGGGVPRSDAAGAGDAAGASGASGASSAFARRSATYHEDARAALRRLAAVTKDASVFHEFPAFRFNPLWAALSDQLNLLAFAREAFGDFTAELRASIHLSAEARRRFRAAASAVAAVSDALERRLAAEACQAWFWAGPGPAFCGQLFTFLPCVGGPRRRRQAGLAAGLRETLRDAKTELEREIDALGDTFEEVRTPPPAAKTFGLAATPVAAVPAFTADGCMSVSSTASWGLPYDLHAWLALVNCLLRYSESLDGIAELLTG